MTYVSTDSGWRHLAILNSIYECQDRDLVEMYTPKVCEDGKDDLPVIIPFDASLYFFLLFLYPSDFLSLA